MNDEQKKAQAEFLDMIKEIFEDGEAEINGNKYKFLTMTHKERRKIFAFYTKVSSQVTSRDMSFLSSPEFEEIEKIINLRVSYNDSLLDRLGDSHWEKYPQDYVTFVTIALTVISYPYFPANPTA